MRTYVFDQDDRLVVILPENAIIEVQKPGTSVVKATGYLEARKALYRKQR